MASHKELRELFLICNADNMLSDEEFLLLWENYESTNPHFPWDSYDPFTIVNMDEAKYKAEFRVEKTDLHRLAEALPIPGTLKCYQGTVCDGTEGLCMLLKRLSYPCRQCVVSMIRFRFLEDLFLSYV